MKGWHATVTEFGVSPAEANIRWAGSSQIKPGA